MRSQHAGYPEQNPHHFGGGFFSNNLKLARQKIGPQKTHEKTAS